MVYYCYSYKYQIKRTHFKQSTTYHNMSKDRFKFVRLSFDIHVYFIYNVVDNNVYVYA
jgi:hypothetical protein